MNFQKNILIGVLAGVVVSIGIVATSDLSIADAQMGGMMGGHGDSSSSSSDHGGGMGSGPSRHGIWYGPGTIHQQCHKGHDMPPHFCEPYYKTMSSVPGVKISVVEPVNEKTLRVTLHEISVAKQGINQKISLSIGGGHLVGTAIVNGGWSGSTTVDVPLNGMGHIYSHESMHVHIFPVTNG
ncbi:hypothetical protein C6988_03130 [Nitrosopumilus sp. b1]|uniref:hypothetical protein n=1 Tax=Nitrosopumilus sp. b1 TaxID=2109907 RepID=UPI0015F435D9|nr:hypothetical protein [Nitrosopumilus sp. b1]KAF6243451.1 hypothetical protein C6988_03130 [Nitrosopumilus sp. b1]